MIFRDVVALWLVREKRATEVVLAACDLLVAGAGGEAVARLAAVTRLEADIEVPILLPEVMRELDLPHHDRGTVEAREAGLRAMAVRVLAGELTPRELTKWSHRVFGHEDEGWRLSELDDAYDTYALDSDEELDAEVLEEARRITS
ncbi:hypothetical protein [Lentzea kentuckyensis]|uniref:hypothetical protein n=1 Tax=Lentzea kentuckyensis TaxID=360086 RepID=UPI000A3B4F1D|nr:hypothetical protein [Lentzea kentuckyensis]